MRVLIVEMGCAPVGVLEARIDFYERDFGDLQRPAGAGDPPTSREVCEVEVWHRHVPGQHRGLITEERSTFSNRAGPR